MIKQFQGFNFQTLAAYAGLFLQVAHVEFSPGSSARGISPNPPLQSGNSTHYLGFSANTLAAVGGLILQVAHEEFCVESSVNGISPFTPLQSGSSTHFY